MGDGILQGLQLWIGCFMVRILNKISVIGILPVLVTLRICLLTPNVKFKVTTLLIQYVKPAIVVLVAAVTTTPTITVSTEIATTNILQELLLYEHCETYNLLLD